MKQLKAIRLLAALGLLLSLATCGGNEVVECDSLDACPFGQVCLREYCTEGVPCEADVDCGDPTIICVNGACVLEAALEEPFVNSPEPSDE